MGLLSPVGTSTVSENQSHCLNGNRNGRIARSRVHCRHVGTGRLEEVALVSSLSPLVVPEAQLGRADEIVQRITEAVQLGLLDDGERPRWRSTWPPSSASRR